MIKFLEKVSMREFQRVFKEISKPLEEDDQNNYVEYNWIVDDIFKNSQPYNKGKVEYYNQCTA